MKTKQLVIALVAVAAVGVFFVLDLGRYLSLEYLKKSQQEFVPWYAGQTMR